jgi:uncharacterized membrane protein YcaP (DUF421 family)
MKPEEIKLWDWPRMLLGEVPGPFLLEIILRMLIVYLIIMVSMRLLGKRMSAQFTRNDLAAMVSLAAAVGVPILAPDRGLLPSVIIAAVVVVVSRLVSRYSAKNEKFERITHGTIDTLVRDGVLDLRVMEKTRISKERILAELRSHGITHLGKVKRLFMEANGIFTVIMNNKPNPGLPVIPDDDPEFLQELKPNGLMVCEHCGNTNPGKDSDQPCPNCSARAWVPALTQ